MLDPAGGSSIDESLLDRSPRTHRSGRPPRPVPPRRRPPLRRQPPPPPRRPAGAARPVGGRARRDAGRALRHLGADPGRAGQRPHDVPRHPRGGLDPKKRTLTASEQDPVARATWRAEVAVLDPATCVFVDETSTSIALTRRYARAPRRQRAVTAVPRNHGTATSLVAALSPAGLGAAMTLQGALDGAAFTVYVRHLL